MKPLILTFLLSICLAYCSLAQRSLHVGLSTAAANTWVYDSYLANSPSYYYNFSYTMYPIGVHIGYQFTPYVGLKVEGLWSRHAQSWDYVDVVKTTLAEYSVEANYFKLPLLFFARTEGRTIKVHFFMGPQFAFLTKGTDKLDYKDPNQTDRVFATTDAPKRGNYLPPFNLNPFDIQAVVGIGLDFVVRSDFYISLLARGEHGFNDIRNKDYQAFVTNTPSGTTYLPGDLRPGFTRRYNLAAVLQLGVTYKFDFGKYD